MARIVRGGRVLWTNCTFKTAEEASTARAAKLAELGISGASPPPEPAPVPQARWIYLSGPHFALIDECDFARVSQINWYFTGGHARAHDPSGRHDSIDLGRFILDLLDNPLEPDHINRNPLDCRRSNLRAATHQENMWNRGPNRNNASGFRGVSWSTAAGKWVAQASIGRKHVHLGCFTSAEEAARARDAWIREHHGSFASLNFPEPPEAGTFGGS